MKKVMALVAVGVACMVASAMHASLGTTGAAVSGFVVGFLILLIFCRE